MKLTRRQLKKLIQEAQEGIISDGNKQLLEQVLYLKLCRCIKHIYIKNIINS